MDEKPSARAASPSVYNTCSIRYTVTGCRTPPVTTWPPNPSSSPVPKRKPPLFHRFSYMECPSTSPKQPQLPSHFRKPSLSRRFSYHNAASSPHDCGISISPPIPQPTRLPRPVTPGLFPQTSPDHLLDPPPPITPGLFPQTQKPAPNIIIHRLLQSSLPPPLPQFWRSETKTSPLRPCPSFTRSKPGCFQRFLDYLEKLDDRMDEYFERRRAKCLEAKKKGKSRKRLNSYLNAHNPEEKHKKQIKQHRSKEKRRNQVQKKRVLEQTRESEENEKSATDAVTENDAQEGGEGTRRRKEGDVGVKEKRYSTIIIGSKFRFHTSVQWRSGEEVEAGREL